MSDVEKNRDAAHIEHVTSKSPQSSFTDKEFTPEEATKLIHRIDRRLITTVGILYCISLMDRTNLSAAAIAGMNKDLDLTVGFRYSIVTLIFFIPYVIFQPPSTVIVRKIGPRIHLASIVVAWGATMIGMGFVHDWHAMTGLRVILGFLEAGYFPGCVYLISTWYVRHDMGKRYSVFYLLGSVASAFAGILAFGLMQMAGVAGLNGWRWIFIWEGILSCTLGIAGYWLIVDFPEDAHKSWRFLKHHEVNYIMRRVDADRSDAHIEEFNLGKYLAAGLDLKIWGFAMIFFNTTTVTYALAYFLPIILRDGMGFSIGASQCLVAPPYVFAGIIMFVGGYLGDRFHLRGLLILFNMALCIIGLPLLAFTHTPGARYFGVFLTCAGANANVPAAMTYQGCNIRGQWKRAFCSATLVGMGGVGGIAGSLVFRSEDAPSYHPGIWACIACSILSAVIVCVLTFHFKIVNRRQARGETMIEGIPDFRYTY